MFSKGASPWQPDGAWATTVWVAGSAKYGISATFFYADLEYDDLKYDDLEYDEPLIGKQYPP